MHKNFGIKSSSRIIKQQTQKEVAKRAKAAANENQKQRHKLTVDIYRFILTISKVL